MLKGAQVSEIHKAFGADKVLIIGTCTAYASSLDLHRSDLLAYINAFLERNACYYFESLPCAPDSSLLQSFYLS